MTQYLKREDVLGKLVIDSDANSLGTVKDIAFSPTGEFAFIVQKKDSEEEITIPVSKVRKIGEFILLKEETAAPTKPPVPGAPYGVPGRPPTAPPTMVTPGQPAPPPPGQPPPSQTQGQVICPVCGNPNPQGTKYCLRCGAPLPEKKKKWFGRF
ncbi:MAG: hypothetical protein DRJ64_10530 [Thermoprotei archaeon]|nr:MAG: hypothetical protein DRJ64_10530 [Thermoprotei archaeon]